MDFCQFFVLNVICVFEVVVCYENFLCVVDELFVMYGVVSYQVCVFEEEFGVQLFMCNGKWLCLIDVGMWYVQQICIVLMVIVDVMCDVCVSDCDWWLVVLMLLLFVVCFIMLCIGMFIEWYLEIDVELQLINLFIDFVCDDVDLVICFGFGSYLGLYVELLFEEVFFLVCVLMLNGGKLLQMFVDFVYYLLLCLDDELWWLWFDVVGFDMLIELKWGILYQDLLNLLLVVIEGQGIVLVCCLFVVYDLFDGCIVCLFDIDGLSLWYYFFVCLLLLFNMLCVQVFWIWLFEEVVEYKWLCDELDVWCVVGKCFVECVLEGGWKGISGCLC